MLKKYESRKYNRVHHYANPVDEERGKIKKETERSFKYGRKMERTIKEFLEQNFEDEEAFDKAKQFEAIVKKESNNAKTHKKRLKKLQREDKDFG